MKLILMFIVLSTNAYSKTLFVRDELGNHTIKLNVTKNPIYSKNNIDFYILTEDLYLQNERFNLFFYRGIGVEIDRRYQSIRRFYEIGHGTYTSQGKTYQLCNNYEPWMALAFASERLVITAIGCIKGRIIQNYGHTYFDIYPPYYPDEVLLVHPNGNIRGGAKVTWKPDRESFALVQEDQQRLRISSRSGFWPDARLKYWFGNHNENYTFKSIDGKLREFRATYYFRDRFVFDRQQGLVVKAKIAQPRVVEVSGSEIRLDTYYEQFYATDKSYVLSSSDLGFQFIISGPSATGYEYHELTRTRLHRYCNKYFLSQDLRDNGFKFIKYKRKYGILGNTTGGSTIKVKDYDGPANVFDLSTQEFSHIRDYQKNESIYVPRSFNCVLAKETKYLD